MSGAFSLRCEELLLSIAENHPDALVHALAGLQRRHPSLCEQASLVVLEAQHQALSSIPPKPAVDMEHKKWLERIMALEGNSMCADCDAELPKWASRNLGVFLCTQCVGVHRTLGRHVSSVASAVLDDWSHDQVRQMSEVGNLRSNARYEFHVPADVLKPHFDADRAEREAYIKAKYIHRQFCARMPNAPPRGPSGNGAGIPSSPSSSPDSVRQAGMVEYLGYVSIRVVCAKDLLNMTIGEKRDKVFSTQVCLTLGTQEVVTKPCKGGVNPVYNEDVMLCWDGREPLQVDVYTRDGEHVGAGLLDLEFLHPETSHNTRAKEYQDLDRKDDERVNSTLAPLEDLQDLEMRRSALEACETVRKNEYGHVIVDLHTRDASRHRRGSSGVAAARANLRRLARGSLLFGRRNAQGAVLLGLQFTAIDH